LPDALRKLRAPLGRELLGVIQAHNASLRIQDDGGSNHRAEQCAAAGLIKTRDARPPQFARRSLETGGAEPAHFAEILARQIFGSVPKVRSRCEKLQSVAK